MTSTLGLSSTANDSAGNCTNLYSQTTGITLTGANTDSYLAASNGGVTSGNASNLHGYATITNAAVGTQYVTLWAASQTAAQTFTGQKINLVIY